MSFITRAPQFFGFTGSQRLLFQPLRGLGRSAQFPRFYSSTSSTLSEKIVCQCKAELPETARIINLFRERNLRQMTEEVRCPYFKSFQFTEANDCKLVDTIEEIATPLLKEFPDVIHVGNSRLVLLESLHKIPEGDLGDLTGDHGKQLAVFLRECVEKQLISKIGSVFDAGGQNTSTVRLISDLMNNKDMPALIIDINSITPALSEAQHNIKYVIEDAHTFFSSERYENHVRGILSEEPSLFIFNNMLNVLKAEDGWNTLVSVWERLRSGDYLTISGLVPEQLGKHGFIKYHEIDGIIEFHHRSKGFYKSALSPDFFEYVKNRLSGASVLIEETFKFSIERKPAHTMDVKGRRLLTLKKVVE